MITLCNDRNNNVDERQKQRKRYRGTLIPTIDKASTAIAFIIGASFLSDAFPVAPVTIRSHTSPLSSPLLQICQTTDGKRKTMNTLSMVLTDIETLLGEEVLDFPPSRRSYRDSRMGRKNDVAKKEIVMDRNVVTTSDRQRLLKIRSKSSGERAIAYPSKTIDTFKLKRRKASAGIVTTPSSVAKSTILNEKPKADGIKGKVADTPKVSKSSTMPGFNYHNTQRVKAYKDGIAIVEKSSGKKIRRNSKTESEIKTRNAQQMYGASASVPDSLIRFTEEIHKESRITPAEEIELGCKTQEGLRLENLYDSLQTKLEREPTDDEYCAAAGKINMEAIRQAVNEGLEAKNRLVTSNLRMVQRVVNLYLRNGLGSQYNAGDLMQDGVMALIRAAEKYDPHRGFRFSTYAMYWIRSSVKRSQILQSRVIDVPQRLHENYKRIQNFRKDYLALYSRWPTPAEVSENVNLSELQINRCCNAMEQRIYSLDADITNPLKAGVKNDQDRKESLYGLIVNKGDDAEGKGFEQKLLKEDLIKSLRTHLSAGDVDLLLLRYGLIDEKTLPHGFSGPLTISELSRLVGMKPDKVRRMINNSLKRLKDVIGNEWIQEII